MLPEIAHDAAPRAFATGEKYRRDPHHAPVACAFVFDEQALMAPRIVSGPRPATSEHEAIAIGARRRVSGGQSHPAYIA
jgi:hypothetical protein